MLPTDIQRLASRPPATLTENEINAAIDAIRADPRCRSVAREPAAGHHMVRCEIDDTISGRTTGVVSLGRVLNEMSETTQEHAARLQRYADAVARVAQADADTKRAHADSLQAKLAAAAAVPFDPTSRETVIKTARYTCGHRMFPDNIASIYTLDDLLQRVNDRKNKALCPDCFRRDYAARKKTAATAAVKLKLPKLTGGTPKQRKFAQVIRVESASLSPDVHELHCDHCGTDTQKWIDWRDYVQRAIDYRYLCYDADGALLDMPLRATLESLQADPRVHAILEVRRNTGGYMPAYNKLSLTDTLKTFSDVDRIK